MALMYLHQEEDSPGMNAAISGSGGVLVLILKK